MKKWLLLALFALFPITLTACGSAARTDTAYVQDGALFVSLEGNPATGYEWTWDSAAEPGCLSGGAREYTPHPAAKPELGAGGVFTFRFDPVAAGEQTLHFSYARGWQSGSTIEEYELTVTVREGKTGFDMSWK